VAGIVLKALQFDTEGLACQYDTEGLMWHSEQQTTTQRDCGSQSYAIRY